MRLYHGTNVDFDNIDLTKSRPNKDFGQGFYLSDNQWQAEELAAARVTLTGGEVVVLEYDFDEALLDSGALRCCYSKSLHEKAKKKRSGILLEN